MYALPAEAPQRVRDRRRDVATLNIGALSCSARHAELGTFDAEVRDLSSHGIALALLGGGASAPMIRAGDSLDPTTLSWMGERLYEGAAMVRHVSTSNDDLTLGVELQSSLDMHEVHRLRVRHSFAQRWTMFQDTTVSTAVSSEFKAWVADIREYLQAAQAFFRDEEQGLIREDEVTRGQAIREHLDVATPGIILRLNTALEELTGLVNDLSADQHSAYRGFFRSHLLSSLMPSRILERANQKPLGYSGDYEMMNLLYREPTIQDVYGAALDRWVLQWGVVRAVKNRLSCLTREIRETVQASETERVQIASIGCGPARELLPLLQGEPDLASRLDVTLVDQDERAISFCERTFTPLAARTGARFHFVNQRVKMLMTSSFSDRAGAMHLIYSAGLFDYLDETSFVSLLRTLYQALGSDGVLLVGNINATPWQWAIEYLSDWFLVHRTPEQLLAHAEGLSSAASGISVYSEPIGINLFLRIRR